MSDYNSEFWRKGIEHNGPGWDDLSPDEQAGWLKQKYMVHCTNCGEPVYEVEGLPNLCEKCAPDEEFHAQSRIISGWDYNQQGGMLGAMFVLHWYREKTGAVVFS